jgi:hypothetical protein
MPGCSIEVFIECDFGIAKRRPKIGDRCYDFLNIFAKKFGEKIGVFDSKRS